MATTCLCGFSFATTEALYAHATSLEHRVKCCCGTIVGNELALVNHRRDVKHSKEGPPAERLNTSSPPTAPTKCGICVNKRPFVNSDARDQHIVDKHNACPACAQVFENKTLRIRHQHAFDHCYCAEHSMAFDRIADLAGHKRAEAHISTFECTNCDRSFRSERALNDHLASEGHNRVIKKAANKEKAEKLAARTLAQLEEANLRCEACNRNFQTIKAFTQHKQSLKHNPLSELKCPLSKDCAGIFSSPSALLFHLESGACKGGMTRNKLNAIVYQHDNDRHITSLAHANRVLSVAASEVSRHSIAPGSSASNRARSVSIDSSRISLAKLHIVEDEGETTSMPSSALCVEDDGSDSCSTSDSDVEFILTPPATRAASTLSGGGAVLTPSASTSDAGESVLADTVSTLSGGGVILTPTASSASNALSDWSFLNSHPKMTPASTSVDGSSTKTITYDTELKRWPCNVCDQTFRKKHDLIQHMNSIVHAPQIFHCPTNLPGLPSSRKPVVNFKTLSGLAQHVEAGSCKGGRATLGFIVGIFEKQIEAKLGQSVKLLKA